MNLARTLSIIVLALLAALGWYLYLMDDQDSKAVALPDPEALQKVTTGAKATVAAAQRFEARVIEERAVVQKAKKVANDATNIRVDAGIMVSDLPMPVQTEYGALLSLASALAHEVEMERQLAETWKAAALANQDAADEANRQLQVVAKAERKKGLKWGAGIGAGAVLLVLVLL